VGCNFFLSKSCFVVYWRAPWVHGVSECGDFWLISLKIWQNSQKEIPKRVFVALARDFDFCLHSPKKNPIRVCHWLGFFVYLLGFGIWNTNREARERERERERGGGTTKSTTNFVIVWRLLPGLRFYLDPARKLCAIPNLQRRFLVGVLFFFVFWFFCFCTRVEA